MMRAVIANGPKDYQLVHDKGKPVLKEGEVLIKVLATGICGSDLKMYEGTEFYWGKGGRARAGVIPGHEFIGSVVEIDPEIGRAESISVGDVVVAEQLLACRDQCWFCKNGMEHKCDRLIVYGQGVDGSMAEYMIYQKGSWLHKVPEGLAPTYAVLAEPLAVSIRAMDRAQLKETDLVLVSGCGTIGLGVIAAIRTYFPRVSIVALDYLQFKLDVAQSITKQCSTFNLSDVTVASIADAVRKMSGERQGADVFFECSGSPHSIKAGFEFLRKCGTFLHVGICKEVLVEAPWNAISAGKELTIVGTNLGRHAWPRAFDILQQCDLSALVTHRLPLEEYATAFGLLNVGIKIVLDPTLPPSTSTSISKSITHSSNTTEPLRIQGSVVFVTGSSRGIGRAIAISVAQCGAKVILHGTSHDSPSQLGEGTTMTNLAKEISTLTKNDQITAVWGDLTTKEAVHAVLGQIHDPIDILICCAGGNIGSDGVNTLSGGKPPQDTCLTITETDATAVMNRNVWTTHLVCQAVAPQMVARRRGHIILIGSTSATIGREKGALYTVSKAAVHQYMRCLATELRSSGVKVNCVAPGPTLTERYRRNIGEAVFTGGTPEQVGNAVVQLLQMDFVNGQVIRVDGGEQTFCC